MPGVENWVEKPLEIVKNIFARYGKESKSHIEEYFTEKLKMLDSSKILSLNDVESDDLRNGALVRYRCMIQDIFDSEMFLESYTIKSADSSAVMCGLYQDVTHCPDDCELMLESSDHSSTSDRLSLYCIPVPAETSWVKEIYGNPSKSKERETASSCQENKRSFDECSGVTNDDQLTDVELAGEGRKKLCCDDKPPVKLADENLPVHDRNFPLATDQGLPCIVKVYDKLEKFKVNDVVEFVGVLSTDPTTVDFKEDENEANDLMEPEAFPEERRVKSPPPSLVCRLHAILANHLEHTNPLLSPLLSSDVNRVKDNICSTRVILLDILKHALFSDSLSAEYLLCNLLSSVYSRADILPVGKFSVNFINSPKKPQYCRLIYKLLSGITTNCHLVELSLENMNKMVLVPYKDYTTNRLCSGLLQLPAGTHLILDETCLRTGKLDTRGLKNVNSLGNLLQWQKVEYDFHYHNLDFFVDIPVLIFSEGSSILIADCSVPLTPQCNPTDLTAYFEELNDKLTLDKLNNIREYLTVMRKLPFSMDPNVQQAIQDDFVQIRQADHDRMSVDDFHILLGLTRLLSISVGHESATFETWERAKELERERKQRLVNQPRPRRS